MTISSETRKAGPFLGTGAVSEYPFDFTVFRAEDLLLVMADENGADSTLVLDSDYTVDLNADQDSSPGGTVTLASPLPADHLLVITSDIAALQPTDLTNQGGFYPSVINTALDRLTILIQQLREQVSRSLKVSITSEEEATPDAIIAEMTAAVGSAAASATAASGSASSASGFATAAEGFKDDAEAAAAAAASKVSKAGDTMTGNLLLDSSACLAVSGSGMDVLPTFSGPSSQAIFRNASTNKPTYVGAAANGTGGAAGFYASSGSYQAVMSITSTGVNLGASSSLAVPTPRPINFSMLTSTGITFNTDGTINCYGILGRQGTSGGSPGSRYSLWWTGSAAQLWVDTTNVGTITLTSDYRIKRDIRTMEQPALARIAALRPVLYQYADNEQFSHKAEDREREGFIAHELAEVIPSAVEGEKDAPNQIQSLRIDALVAVLVKAVQEQQAQINELRALVGK